ncbi:MAG: preprotein translocase subunit SecG [Candidatus Puniceispirillaceae bacterium]
MQTVLLTIHTLIALALVGLVLLQRSEGGGLGIGGGGGAGGGFMTARGAANLLTKATAALATCFFLSSIGLAILAGAGTKQTSIVDEVLNATPAVSSEPSKPAVPTGN